VKWNVDVQDVQSRLRYSSVGLTFSNSTFCPHSEFGFVWISEQTAIISLHRNN